MIGVRVVQSWSVGFLSHGTGAAGEKAHRQVVDAYRKYGFDMLLQAFNETDYLERLTGLDELHKESEAVLDSLDWEEGSEGDF